MVISSFMIVQSQVFNYCNCVRLALLSSSFTYIISSYCREDSISNFRNCILTLRLLSMLSTPNYIKTLSVWHKDDSLSYKTSNNFDMPTMHCYSIIFRILAVELFCCLNIFLIIILAVNAITTKPLFVLFNAPISYNTVV